MATVQVSLTVSLAPKRVFDLLVRELETALGRQGLGFEGGPDGRLREGADEVATVTLWPAEKGPNFSMTLRWNAPPWKPGRPTALAVKLRRAKGGTRVTVTHEGWGGAVGKPPEVVGWFADQVAAPRLRNGVGAVFFGRSWLDDRTVITAPPGHAVITVLSFRDIRPKKTAPTPIRPSLTLEPVIWSTSQGRATK